MKITNNPFSNVLNNQPQSSVGKSAENFGKLIKDFVSDVNTSQIDALHSTESFVNGEDVEIHEVMIAGEKAKTSLELLMEIRNKTVDMYKELNRIQV